MSVLFPLYIVASAVGLMLLRMVLAGEKTIAGLLTNWRFLLGGTLYAGGFLLWLLLLRRFELGFIFPIAAGSLFVATMTLGILVLHEPVSVGRLVGATVIVAGIAIISASA